MGAGLRIGGDAGGIVVGSAGDEPRPQQSEQHVPARHERHERSPFASARGLIGEILDAEDGLPQEA
jgi:hypothetical protein